MVAEGAMSGRGVERREEDAKFLTRWEKAALAGLGRRVRWRAIVRRVTNVILCAWVAGVVEGEVSRWGGFVWLEKAKDTGLRAGGEGSGGGWGWVGGLIFMIYARRVAGGFAHPGLVGSWVALKCTLYLIPSR